MQPVPVPSGWPSYSKLATYNSKHQHAPHSAFSYAPLRRFSDQSEDLDQDFLVPIPYGSIDDGSWKARLDAFFRFFRFKDRTELGTKYEAFKMTPTSSFILITGPAGVGKTSLAKTLQPVVEKDGGYFLRGKFDFLQRLEPYTAFDSAFTEFTNLVISRGKEETKKTEEAIKCALGEEIGVLIRMIPSLHRILGNGHSTDDRRNTADALQLSMFVFRLFVRAICLPEQPIVLLLDDLHYADPCSLDLLTSLVTDQKTENMVIIGTCQDDFTCSDCYLSKKLRDIDCRQDCQTHRIALENMSEQVIRDMLMEVFHLSCNQCDKLAELLFLYTDGNLLYIKEMLQWLQDSDLLVFEAAQFGASCTWDDDEIRMATGSRKVKDILLDKVRAMPYSTQEVLKVAACLGSRLDMKLLDFVIGDPVRERLEDATKVGLIDHDEALYGYSFPHDEVQIAAYRLIPEKQREKFHLEIGRQIWRKIESAQDLDRHIYAFLSQINFGSQLITRKMEQVNVARACVHAGAKAAKASAFRTAAVYCELGLKLLNKRIWRENYELALCLHNSAAEMAMCTANFERMEEIVAMILQNAKIYRDKVPAYALTIYSIGFSVQQQQAGIEIGLKVLEHLGEKLPHRLLLRACAVKEALRVKRLLWGKSDEQLLRMPLITDQDKLACLKILHAIFASVQITRLHLMPVVVLKCMELTIKYGLSAFASVAFTWYGLLHVGPLSTDIETAFRYGRIGMKLLEQFNTNQYASRVFLANYGFIYPWKYPAADALEPIMVGHQIGLAAGDFEAAGFCAANYIYLSFEAGIRLDKILSQCKIFIETIVSSRLESAYSLLLPTMQVLQNLIGVSDDPLSRMDDGMDCNDVILRGSEKHKVVARSLRMMTFYLLNDHRAAGVELSQIRSYALFQLSSLARMIQFTFFAGMVALALARMGDQPRANKRKARHFLNMLTLLRFKAPHMTLSKIFLLEAELASVCHNKRLAMDRYFCAAGSASFGWVKGLANERIARHLCTLGRKNDARPYFEIACTSFLEWGAARKYEHLRAEMDSLF